MSEWFSKFTIIVDSSVCPRADEVSNVIKTDVYCHTNVCACTLLHIHSVRDLIVYPTAHTQRDLIVYPTAHTQRT